MAKRLNKKVALIGLVVFLILGVVGIVIMVPLLEDRFRNPQDRIEAGDAAVKAASEAVDEATRTDEYEKALQNYGRARSYAKTDPPKIEILFKMVDVYIKLDRWGNAYACWKRIVDVDPENIEARLRKLEYVYITSDAFTKAHNTRGGWPEVETQASEFIEVTDGTDVLGKSAAEWGTFPGEPEQHAVLGAYIYLCRGRARLEIVISGAVTDLDEKLAQAVDDLKKVLEFEPNSVDAHWYLARAIKEKGDIAVSIGRVEEKGKAMKEAEELLQEAVARAGDNPRAHTNLLRMRTINVRETNVEQIPSLESEYLQVVEKFGSSPEAYWALAQFYSVLGHKSIDKAIEALDKAIELDPENVLYAIFATNNLYYRKFSIYGQKDELYKAIETAKSALTFPDAQDTQGPRSATNRTNRLSLYIHLAQMYVQQILEPCEARTEQQKQQLMADAQQAVHEIEQIIGSGEHPVVIKWRGMLELARGNRDQAIRLLYPLYEQYEADPSRRDAYLAYTLAKVFEDTSEVGAVVQFFETAFKAGIGLTKPQVYLDCAETLLRLRRWSDVIGLANSFDEGFGSNERSRTLRIKAYIGANQLADAEDELAKADVDAVSTIKLKAALVLAKIRQTQRAIREIERQKQLDPALRKGKAEDDEAANKLIMAELKRNNDTLAALVEILLARDPNSVEETSIIAVCNNYRKEKNIEQAKALINRFLGYFPENTRARLYERILAEPEVETISEEKQREIEYEVLSTIKEPIKRSVQLGVFYLRQNEPNKAVEEFEKVSALGDLEQPFDSNKPGLAEPGELADLRRVATDNSFEVALGSSDWQLAEKIVEAVRRKNIDRCEGSFFAARLELARGRYEEAAARIEECLKQRPVFSRGYILRSTTNAALGNELASLEDARKAASLNPLDGAIAKRLVFVLLERNKNLGSNVSSQQIRETLEAFLRALSLNPVDFQLRSNYAAYSSIHAEVINPEQPKKVVENALASLQALQRAAPSVDTDLRLGKLATTMALREADEQRKEALFDIAGSAFQQAREKDPNDERVLETYAEYYRVKGDAKKGEQLLLEAGVKKLVWRYYAKQGQFEDARETLEGLYRDQPNDSTVVEGLVIIADRTGDQEAAKRYSEELIALDSSTDKLLFQVQTFLKVGLVKEADYKLQSFRERYPDDPRALLLGAWVAVRQGQLKKALELVNMSLAANENNATAWRLRGQISYLRASYDRAINDLQMSNSLSPEPVTRIALARAYLRAGRPEDAITELVSTINQPQAPMEARTLLEEIYLRDESRTKQLKQFYNQTLNRFPDSVYWFNRAGAFAATQKDFSLAEQLYSQAWQKSDKESKDAAVKQALDGYLKALILGEKYDKVVEEAGKYTDSYFAPIAFLRMAEVKLQLGDRDTAVRYCRKAVDKAGTDETFGVEVLTKMYYLLGGPEEVRRYCEERIRKEPLELMPYIAMVQISQRKGEVNKALIYVEKCLNIIGDDNNKRVEYQIRKATLLQEAYNKTTDKKYLTAAIHVYQSLITEMPNNYNVMNNLAYMMAENQENPEVALKYSQRVYELKPNNPAFLDTYAYVLYRNGRYEKAQELVHNALQQYEQNRMSVPADVYKHLGMIKEKVGAKNEALEAYRQALQVEERRLSKSVEEEVKAAIKRISE